MGGFIPKVDEKYEDGDREYNGRGLMGDPGCGLSFRQASMVFRQGPLQVDEALDRLQNCRACLTWRLLCSLPCAVPGDEVMSAPWPVHSLMVGIFRAALASCQCLSSFVGEFLLQPKKMKPNKCDLCISHATF